MSETLILKSKDFQNMLSVKAADPKRKGSHGIFDFFRPQKKDLPRILDVEVTWEKGWFFGRTAGMGYCEEVTICKTDHTISLKKENIRTLVPATLGTLTANFTEDLTVMSSNATGNMRKYSDVELVREMQNFRQHDEVKRHWDLAKQLLH